MPAAVLVPPAREPVSLARAKAQVRVDLADTSEDELIEGYIAAAREQVEGDTRRALPLQTWEYTTDAFPRCGFIELPHPPLVAVQLVSYVDAAGIVQTMDPTAYVQETAPLVGRVSLAHGASWPAARRGGPVTIRYVCGYQEGAVPARLVNAMLLLIGHWHGNRSQTVTGTIIAELPKGYDSLIGYFRVPRGVA